MKHLLAILLGALGNRQWGAGVDEGYPKWLYSKYLATALMTYAIVLLNPASYGEWSPVIALFVFAFRVEGTGDNWLAVEADAHVLHAAVVRAAAALPLGILLTYLDYRHTHLVYAWHLIASAGFPLLGLSYYVAGKLWPVKATELAELFDGGYLVSMAASAP